MTSPALELRDVEVTYRRPGKPPLRSVAGASLVVGPGQVVGLVGESGCGKSSLARAAVGLLHPTGGEVLFEGRPIRQLRGGSTRSLADVKLQMVFQDPYSSLNPRRTIAAHIADGLRAVGVPAARYRARALELIELVGLSPDLAEAYPHQLSGGQRQRMCIARALAVDPTVIVADEPISALDASAQASVAKLFLDLSREMGVGVLFISHDLAVVRELADITYVMYLGKIVESGPTEEVWENGLHPYSRALMSSIPEPDGLGTLPAVLEGEVPDPGSPPSGCRFHPRCPLVFEPCADQEPELTTPVSGRAVSCWLHTSATEPVVAARAL